MGLFGSILAALLMGAFAICFGAALLVCASAYLYSHIRRSGK